MSETPAVDRKRCWLALARQAVGWPSYDAYGGTNCRRQHRRRSCAAGQKEASRRLRVKKVRMANGLSSASRKPHSTWVSYLAAPKNIAAMKALDSEPDKRSGTSGGASYIVTAAPGGAQQRHGGQLGEPGQL